MRSRSTQVSLICTNVALRVVSQQPWAQLMSLLTWMIDSGFAPDGHSFCTILASLSSWPLCLRTLLERTDRSPILVNAAISSSKSWTRSFQVLSELRHDRLPVDSMLLNKLLGSLEEFCQWKTALAFLADCAEKPIAMAAPNVVSLNICLSACEKAAGLQLALSLLQSMEDKYGFGPDVVSFTAVLKTCAKMVEWECALQQLTVMRHCRILPDVIAYNSAITACAEAMNWLMTLQMLKDAQRVDTVTFNAVLKGMEKSMHWEYALAIVFGMHVPPSLVTYNTLMSACQKCSEWQWSLQLLVSGVLASKLVPDLITYNTCFAACKKGSCWQEALQLADKPVVRTD